jgi:hypothetical protein
MAHHKKRQIKTNAITNLQSLLYDIVIISSEIQGKTIVSCMLWHLWCDKLHKYHQQSKLDNYSTYQVIPSFYGLGFMVMFTMNANVHYHNLAEPTPQSQTLCLWDSF